MTDQTYTPQCPACGAEQSQSLLCSACCDKLERTLGDVRWIVTELDTALSKQARIGTPGKGGLAREKNPVHYGAIDPRWVLDNTLSTWARDLMGVPDARWNPAFAPNRSPAITASRILLSNVDQIRRHPAVRDLVDEITDAVEQARRAVDRPADRQYLGQCHVTLPGPDGVDVTCFNEIWARADAHEVACKVCGITHVVEERRAWLLLKAADMLCTVKEASRYIGDVGGIAVTEASIRGYIHRQRLAYRVGTTTFRLGDLLEVLTDMKAKAAA